MVKHFFSMCWIAVFAKNSMFFASFSNADRFQSGPECRPWVRKIHGLHFWRTFGLGFWCFEGQIAETSFFMRFWAAFFFEKCFEPGINSRDFEDHAFSENLRHRCFSKPSQDFRTSLNTHVTQNGLIFWWSEILSDMKTSASKQIRRFWNQCAPRKHLQNSV